MSRLNLLLKHIAQPIHSTRLFAFALALSFAPVPTLGTQCAAPSRFRTEGGEAIDIHSKLVWKRCSHGLDWRNGEGCGGAIRGLPQAEAFETAKAAGGQWRLPTADELLTLVDRACGEPAIDAAAFPDVPLDPGGDGSLYWSATDAGMLNMAITVDFRDGTYDMHSRGLNYFVRLVRSRD